MDTWILRTFMKRLLLLGMGVLLISSCLAGCQKRYDPSEDKIVYENDSECDDVTFERLDDAVQSLITVHGTASEKIESGELTLDDAGNEVFEEASNMINDYCDISQKEVTQKEAEASIENINQLIVVISQLAGISEEMTTEDNINTGSDINSDAGPDDIIISDYEDDGINQDGTYKDDRLNEHIDASDDETPPDVE